MLNTGGWLAVAVTVAVAAGVGVAPAAADTGGAGGPAAGTVSTVAGGVGGPAKATTVALDPCGVTWSGGFVYAADTGAVRKVSSSGFLTTPAGTEAEGPLGEGGAATRASLYAARGVAVDRSGNLVIADDGNERVRVVAAATGSFYGRAMTAGDIYTVAGDGTDAFSGDGGPATSAELSEPEGVVVDGAGNLLIAATGNSRVREVAG
jgi:hypothetical protein